MVEKSSFAQEDDPPIVFATAIAPSAPSEAFQSEWACPKCTLLNSVSKIRCDACYFRQPGAPLPSGEMTASDTSPETLNNIKTYRQHGASVVEPPAETVPLVVTEDICDSHTEEDPFYKKMRRRRRRKRRMAAGGVLGCVVGAVILCFPGAVLGAIGGAWGARTISKRREHVKDERLAKERLGAAQPVEGEPVKVVD
ncbi:MAG: hypothetical protein SGILL_010149 [Bacillariaceae sp.]